jgi:hypothetical protein
VEFQRKSLGRVKKEQNAGAFGYRALRRSDFRPNSGELRTHLLSALPSQTRPCRGSACPTATGRIHSPSSTSTPEADVSPLGPPSFGSDGIFRGRVHLMPR